MAKSKYKDYVLPRLNEVTTWAEAGLMDYQIAKNLDISNSTFNKYRNDYTEFSEAIKKGRVSAVAEVENALYKNAVGYDYYVDEVTKVKNNDGSESVVINSIKKHKAGETAAQAFFLKNKAKERYSDNPQLIDLRREEFKHKKEIDSTKGW